MHTFARPSVQALFPGKCMQMGTFKMLECVRVQYSGKKYCGGPLFLPPAVMVTNCANNLLVLHCKCKFLKKSCNVKQEGFFISFILLFCLDLIPTPMF